MSESAFGGLWCALLVLGGGAALTACGGPSSEAERTSEGEAARGSPPMASPAETAPDLAIDDVGYLSRLGLIRGHLRVGMALYRAGQVMHAQSHMKHPGDELYAALEGVFATRGSEGFAEELEALATAVEREAPVTEVNAAYDRLLAAVSRAESHVADGLATDAAAQTAIVANLIATAAEEYGIGVNEAGRVTDVHEYQDAYGFTLVARERATAARDRVEVDAKRHALAMIAEEVESLLALWPTLVPSGPIAVERARLEMAAARIETAAAER